VRHKPQDRNEGFEGYAMVVATASELKVRVFESGLDEALTN
jgi:hypothetical protein